MIHQDLIAKLLLYAGFYGNKQVSVHMLSNNSLWFISQLLFQNCFNSTENKTKNKALLLIKWFWQIFISNYFKMNKKAQTRLVSYK